MTNPNRTCQPEVWEWLEHLTEYVNEIANAMLDNPNSRMILNDVSEAKRRFNEQMENL